MKLALRMAVVAALVVTALAAKPALDVDEIVRRANAAFADADYVAALGLYEQAEAGTTDPGLIAYNKAAAYVRLAKEEKSDLERQKLHALAERHYRCCLEDAEGLRRARALLGRGNSLVFSGRGDEQALESAVRTYRECLRLAEGLDDALAADARHNLEVAKTIWLKLLAEARKTPPPEDPANDPAGTNHKKPSRPDGSGDPNRTQGDPQSGDPQPIPGANVKQPRDGHKPRLIDRPSPNRGARAPGHHEQPRAQAEVDLEEAVERIILKRRAGRGAGYAQPNGVVKDW